MLLIRRNNDCALRGLRRLFPRGRKGVPTLPGFAEEGKACVEIYVKINRALSIF